MGTKFIWLDLETTGRNPNKCQPFAIEMVVTDEKLNEFGRFEQLSNPSGAGWDPEAFKMHDASGLYQRARASANGWATTAWMADYFLESQDLDPTNTYFAGSSVHFDIDFLKVHSPYMLKHASHRLLDVSVFKVLAKAWGLQERQNRGPTAHEPIKDLAASMADLRHWVYEFGMWTQPEVPAELMPGKGG